MSYDLGTAHGTIEVDYDGKAAALAAQRDLENVGDEARESDRDLKGFKDRLESVFKVLSSLGKLAGGLVLATTISQAAIGAGALLTNILGVVPALASLVSFAALLPGYITGAVLAMGVLRAATAGVGDALSAAVEGDAAAFEEAIKGLSPAAREFATAFRDAMPAIKEVQQGIQESFFGSAGLAAGVQAGLRGLQAMAPILNGISSRFGLLAQELVRVGTGAEALDFVSDSGLGLQRVLDALLPSIEPIIQGLIDAGTVGLPVLTNIGIGVAGLIAQFGEWLTYISETGQLAVWLQQAVTVAGQLASIIGNVGRTLSNVFQIAELSGGGLLGTLEEITGVMLAFTESTAGVQTLDTLFSTLTGVASTLAPILLTLAAAVIQGVGPALLELAQTVGPILLDMVQRLAPVFAPLSQAILSLFQAIAPLLPAVAQFVTLLGTMLGGSIQVLAAQIGPLVGLIGTALAGAFEALMPVITELISNGLPLAIEMGMALAEAFAPLVPVIITLAQTLAAQLLPILPELQKMIGEQLIPAMTQLAMVVSESLMQAFTALAPYIPVLVQAFAAMVPVMVTVVTTIIRVMTFLIQLGQAFARFPGQVMGFIQGFPGMLINWAKRAIDGALYAFGYGIGLIINLVTRWIPRMMAAIAGFPSQLGSLASRAWTSARNAFNSGINNLVSLARGLPGKISSAVGNLGSLLYGAGRDAIQGLINGINSLVDRAASIARNAANRVAQGIKDALKIGSPSRLLFQYGAWTTEGFINGLDSLRGKLEKTAEMLAGTAIAPTVGNTNSSIINTSNISNAYGGTDSRPAPTVVNNVTALPGMDALEVATYTTRKLLLALDSGVNSFTTPVPSAA